MPVDYLSGIVDYCFVERLVKCPISHSDNLL